MTIPAYEITITNVTQQILTDVVSFNCRNGRSTKTDVYASSTASFTFRNPQNLFTGAVIGALVVVKVNTYSVYSGFITNIQYNYGIVENEDTATISLEGYLSFMGRGYLNGFALTGLTTGAEAQRIGTSLTGSAKTISNQNTKSLTDTSSFTGSAQNLITTLVGMEQGRLTQGAAGLGFLGRDDLQDPTANPYNFSNFRYTDVLPVASGISYDSIEFANLTDNYYTQTTVTPATVAPQFEGTGDRNLQISTYDPTTTQADNLARYMLAEFISNTSDPISISTRNSLGWTRDPASMVSLNPIGWRLPITFRDAIYQTVIEGWSVTATPDDVRYTFYLSSFTENNFLKLGDSVYGVLGGDGITYNQAIDYNEVGYIYNDAYADDGCKLGF